MLQGEFVGKLNVELFFETLSRLVGEEYGADITVKSITKNSSVVAHDNVKVV